MKRTPSKQTVENVDWLLNNDVPALYVPTALGRSPETIEKAVRREGRDDLRRIFGPIAKEDRYWKRKGGHRPIGGAAA